MKRCPNCGQPLAADVGCLNINCPSFHSTNPAPKAGNGAGILAVDATKIDKRDFNCVFCGTKFATDANFCGECGKSRAESKAASATSLRLKEGISSPLIPTFSRHETDAAVPRTKVDTSYSYIRPPHNDPPTTVPPPRRPRRRPRF